RARRRHHGASRAVPRTRRRRERDDHPPARRTAARRAQDFGARLIRRRPAMRQLYLAATGQNRGKTTAALGLVNGFLARGLRTGFMKPVGQRTVIDQGEPADEDAVLMHEVFGLPEPYSVMSPVHIPRGFTKAY